MAVGLLTLSTTAYSALYDAFAWVDAFLEGKDCDM